MNQLTSRGGQGSPLRGINVTFAMSAAGQLSFRKPTERTFRMGRFVPIVLQKSPSGLCEIET